MAAAWDALAFITWAQLGAIEQGIAASGAVVVAVLVAVMPFARRPRLSLAEDPDRTQSRVEETWQGDIPSIRLLARNRGGRRAARDVRVIVEGYRPLGDTAPRLTSLGHPSLSWPSARGEDAVTVFSGGDRPVGLGQLIRVRLRFDGDLMRPSPPEGLSSAPHYDAKDESGDPPAEGWRLWLGDLDISDDRDKLRRIEGGYAIRLLIGAEDGDARRYDVHIDWNPDPSLTADDVLASALDHLAVIEA